MQPLPEQIIEPLERINAVYFSDPGRTIELAQGEQLVDQGEECRRVYYVQKGSFAAFRRADSYAGVNLPVESSTRGYEVFRAEAGSYVCVQAFFSRSYHSSNQIVALEDSVVTYVDDTTEVVEPEKYGCFERQFIPVLVHELAARNSRIFTKTSEKEEALRVLQRAEMASSLAQLSAGIAHELNNAVGVLSRRTEFVADSLQEYLEDDDKNNALLFSYGFEDNSFVSAQELRSAARYYERELKAAAGSRQSACPHLPQHRRRRQALRPLHPQREEKLPLLGARPRPARYAHGLQTGHRHRARRETSGRWQQHPRTRHQRGTKRD
ncbi:MAG: hypothetical protein IKA55_06050 [Akkermansia sp.]|nr:hypothetical protein [Akkermansia sp.]